MATVTRQNPPKRPLPAKPPPKSTPKPAGNKNHPPAKGLRPSRSASLGGASGNFDGLFGTPPFTICQYGPPGVGKTSMWAFLPEVGFVYDSKEEGIIDLYQTGQCPQPVWSMEVEEFESESNERALLTVLANAANHEYPIKNLVVDSMTGMQLLCFTHHCREYFDNDWSKEGFYAFQQGPNNAATKDWPRLLDALDQVRKAGINVVFIAHSQVKDVNNPAGADYAQFMPAVHKEIWQQTARWAKAIFFQNYDVTLEKKGIKTKASGGEDRQLYTSPAAAYVAKNRWGLEPVINLGGSAEEAYEAFCDAYKTAWKVN